MNNNRLICDQITEIMIIAESANESSDFENDDSSSTESDSDDFVHEIRKKVSS